MTHSPEPDALHNLWIDLELTGLITELDDIVEVGVIGTTVDLRPLFTETIVIRPTDSGLNRIVTTPPVFTMHAANGLLAELLAGADTLPTVADAEQEILALIDRFPAPEDGILVLAGSGVAHCDMRFLQRHMPILAARLDSREILDVGFFRRAYRRATGRDLTEANAGKNHRADVDIQCSLDEGRAYFDLFRANELVGARS